MFRLNDLTAQDAGITTQVTRQPEPLLGSCRAEVSYLLGRTLPDGHATMTPVVPLCRVFSLERVTGVEPASSTWEAVVSLLSHQSKSQVKSEMLFESNSSKMRRALHGR